MLFLTVIKCICWALALYIELINNFLRSYSYNYQLCFGVTKCIYWALV